VEVPHEVREIPVLEERVALGVEEQPRRYLAVEGVSISRAPLVKLDTLRVDLVLVAAEILADGDAVGR
jgi:hypothetical protein